MSDITVTGTETLEEIYFLIRTGTWHPEHLKGYLDLKEDAAYTQGVDDSRQDGYSHHEVDDAYSRGYDNGHNDGFRDGYADGSREAAANSYDDHDRGRW